MMNNLNDIDVEEKAEKCREFEEMKSFEIISGCYKGKFFSRILEKTKLIPGVWAIEKDGEFYCFMKDKKPSCAGRSSEVLEMIYQSAIDSGEITTETGRHYICNIKNKQYQEKI